MKRLVKRILEVLGHALTVSVHERLDHAERALDVVIDQNNRMARTQTALLQSSIHMVTTLNRLQTDLEALRRTAARLSDRSDDLIAAVDKTLASVTTLKRIAESQAESLGTGDSGTGGPEPQKREL